MLKNDFGNLGVSLLAVERADNLIEVMTTFIQAGAAVSQRL